MRQDVFTLDAHAWALAANGQIAHAREVMARAVGQGTEDGRLFLHVVGLRPAAGRRAEARRWLKKSGRAPESDAPAVRVRGALTDS